MGSLRFALVIILATHFYKTNGDVPPLNKLQDNKLLVGRDTEYSFAAKINCKNRRIEAGFGRSRTLQLSEALNISNFGTYSFFCEPLTARGQHNFKITEVKHTNSFESPILKETVTAYVILEDPSGESAFWLPQGQHIDIPRIPEANEPKYVFTNEFSGSSLTITPMNNSKLRLRHVLRGNGAKEFNNLTVEDKGGAITYAMQFKDYGYVGPMGKLVKSVFAFAYMHFSEGNWKLYIQRHTCAPRPIEEIHKSLEIFEMKYYQQTADKIIGSTSVFRIL